MMWEKARSGLHSAFMRNVAVLAGGAILGRGLVALVSPLVTRLYSPDAMGRAGTFVAFINFVSVAACLRYDVAVVSAKNARDAAHLVVISLLSTVATSLLFMAVLYFLQSQSLLGFGVLPWYCCLLVLPVVIPTAVYGVFRYWHVREGQFSLVSGVLVIQNAARAFSQISLGFLGMGWSGLVGADAIGRVCGLQRMASTAWPKIKEDLEPLRTPIWRQVLNEYRKFPLYSAPSSLIDALALNLPLPLVAHFYGAGAAGQFALVQLVYTLPISLIGASIGDAFYSRIAIYAREQPERAESFFAQVAGMLTLIGLVPLGCIGILGPLLFEWIFGQQWAIAGAMTAVMVPWALGMLVVSPLSQVVFAFQGQEAKFVFDGMNLCAVGGTLYLGHMYGLSVVENIRVLSVVEAALLVFYFFLLRGIMTRHIKSQEKIRAEADNL